MTGDVRSYDRGQLAQDLAMLSGRTVASRADLEFWNLLASGVRARLLASNPAGLGPLPESLRDYLADAELRFSDPEYAAAQQRIIGRLIDHLRMESELAPAAFG
jgi:hypothetical protein